MRSFKKKKSFSESSPKKIPHPTIFSASKLLWNLVSLISLPFPRFFQPSWELSPDSGLNPEHSLKGLMLKLKLQYFGHLMRTADILEKTLMGKIEGRMRRRDRGWDGWMASPIQGHQLGQTPGDGEGQGCLVCCSPWGREELDMTWWLNNNNNNYQKEKARK